MAEIVNSSPPSKALASKVSEDLRIVSQRFEAEPPQAVLRYALEQYFPDIILACSFGAEDMVLADMLFTLNPRARLFYLDTGFLFPETLDVRDRMMAKYQLAPDQVLQVTPRLTPEEQANQYGPLLWVHHPDQCCTLRKVEPLMHFLKGYAAWITGIRRDQSPTRANAGLVEWDAKFGLVKFNPLACWTSEAVWRYIREHDVPYNPLHDQGYPSIGCTHCTSPVQPGEDPRAGRWRNLGKTECGLHK
ncbi:MAG: phosphoadenylyl-sulfate reductase [Nitrospirae bacterium]|nr:MAG: phosphoadenylyl-sulfate reductase [Nitrospirota bacterium]